MSLLQTFQRDQRGNMATVFALTAIPLMGATGAGIDYSNAFRQRSLIQDAMDSAALAANRKIGSATTAQIQTEANNFYQANVAGQVKNPPAITTAIVGGQVTITTTLTVPTSFLGIMGLDNIVFDLKSVSTAGTGRLEVALVLDTSGSMAGTKISSLKTAATNLTNQLFALAATSTKVDPIKMAVVPFSSAVNVGPQYSTATWMDLNGKGTYHAENLDASWTQNRFTIYSSLKNTPWAGCVEERPMPYDVQDDPPSTATSPSTEQAKTLFVPMLAPDEPDSWTCTTTNCTSTGSGSSRAYSGAPTGSYNYNNWVKDNGGNCSGSNSAYTNSSNEQAQLPRSCKYNAATPTNMTAYGLTGGPNFMCNSKPLTPLTTSQSTITTAISGLSALGATNITAGVMWGWRVLSPGIPFTEGRAYNNSDNKKVLIMMTDGENTYYPISTYKGTIYGAYGYIANNHLGTTSTTQSTEEAAMDTRSKAACDNIKAAGVLIYTIAFEVTTQRGKDVMAYCASDSGKAFDASNETALLQAFDAIGTDISRLRLEN